MVKISKKLLLYLTIGYIYVPIALFLFGWTKLWIACTCCAALLFAIRRMCADYLSGADSETEDTVCMKRPAFVLILLFLLLVGYYAGWGRWVTQSSDWHKHNLLLMDLTQKSWPVYYVNGDEHSMLSYYIAQYLIPTFVGKCFRSVRLAEIVNYVWAEIGLILVYLNLLRVAKLKRISMWFVAAFLLVFFSIPMLLANFVRWIVYPEMGAVQVFADGHWFSSEMGGTQIQYSSNFALLRWVFPQTIVPWLITLLFLEHKRDIRHYMTLFVPGLLFSTLPLLGMVPLAAGHALWELFTMKKLSQWLKSVFSLENLLVFCSFGMVSLFYILGNVTEVKPEIFGFHIMPYRNGVVLYFIFIGICVCPYAWILYQENKKNSVFYTAILTLCVLPVFRMGVYNDLTMRSSIPALFVLMTLSLRHLDKFLEKSQIPHKISDIRPVLMEGGAENLHIYLTGLSLCLLLLIGSWYPWLEFRGCVRSDDFLTLGNEIELGYAASSHGSLETYANRQLGTGTMIWNYFSYDIEHDFFYQHIARTRLPESS